MLRRVRKHDLLFTCIEIQFNSFTITGKITVWNDGPGIEPVMHKSGKGLIPEVQHNWMTSIALMIGCHLLVV